MNWTRPACPECRGEPVGLVESLFAVAEIQANGDGGYEYAGGSRICWDTQITHKDSDAAELLQCSQGHEWATGRTEGEGEQA